MNYRKLLNLLPDVSMRAYSLLEKAVGFIAMISRISMAPEDIETMQDVLAAL